MPFKMKSGSPMKRNFNAGSSPVKDKMSTSMVSEATAKSHNADYTNNPDHLENMHGKGRNTSIADAEAKKKTK